MIATQQDNLPFVIFQIKESQYAVSSQIVREIIVAPPITTIPKTMPEVRGVFNLRGKIVRLIDLRVKLGLPPLRADLDELIQLLCDREQDHRKWLAELEACVRERRSFGMARDPHKCKFGLWYDQFSTRDRLLRMTLPSMDAPHKAIHATADEALRRAESGDVDGALGLILSRRNAELSALIKLFEESRRTLLKSQREVAIVLSGGKDGVAFSADSVEAAEHIPENNIECMPVALASLSSRHQIRVGRRLKSDQTILILDNDFFFQPVATN